MSFLIRLDTAWADGMGFLGSKRGSHRTSTALPEQSFSHDASITTNDFRNNCISLQLPLSVFQRSNLYT